jgi:glucan 1,3-beta-glucosidase
MLGPSLILGLSTCAFALNIRSEGSYGHGGYSNDQSPSLTTSTVYSTLYITKPSSKPTPVANYNVYDPSYSSSVTGLIGYPHKPSGVPYSIGGNGAYGKPGPTGTGTHGKPSSTGTPDCAPYWLENIKHQGLASFNPNVSSYEVFRNVKDYGAKGDGRTDDTAAIQRAIADGNRCTPGYCESTTTTPALVYFPGGTYVISASIIDYYYTQIIGNPNCLPTIQAAANFSLTSGLGLIDGSPYQGAGPRVGKTGYGATNTFFRQIRNLILDTTNIPANLSATGLHWPTAQTTSLQNVVFNMNAETGTQHQGLFIEEGSGGFMTDLVFNGGNNGFNVGNQQFTTRNLTFNNVNTAINQLWDWGWTYSGLRINNCRVGLNMSSGGSSALTVGSITLIDSEISNTPIGVVTARTDSSMPAAAGSLYMENVKLNNVGVAVLGPKGTYLPGSSGTTIVNAWADGHRMARCLFPASSVREP